MSWISRAALDKEDSKNAADACSCCNTCRPGPAVGTVDGLCVVSDVVRPRCLPPPSPPTIRGRGESFLGRAATHRWAPAHFAHGLARTALSDDPGYVTGEPGAPLVVRGAAAGGDDRERRGLGPHACTYLIPIVGPRTVVGKRRGRRRSSWHLHTIRHRFMDTQFLQATVSKSFVGGRVLVSSSSGKLDSGVRVHVALSPPRLARSCIEWIAAATRIAAGLIATVHNRLLDAGTCLVLAHLSPSSARCR